MVPLLSRIPALPESLLPVWVFCGAHQAAVFSTSPHLQGWKCILVTLLLGNMLVTHWGAQESRVITRKPVSVVRFKEWGQCQRQEAKLMRSGAVWSEEPESNTLPWIGYHPRFFQLNTASCCWPKSRYDQHPLEVCSAQPEQPHKPCCEAWCSFVLSTFAVNMEGAWLAGWDRHTGFFLVSPVSFFRILPYQQSYPISELGFIQNLQFVSDFWKSSLFPGRKQPAPPTVEPSAVLNTCSSP